MWIYQFCVLEIPRSKDLLEKTFASVRCEQPSLCAVAQLGFNHAEFFAIIFPAKTRDRKPHFGFLTFPDAFYFQSSFHSFVSFGSAAAFARSSWMSEAVRAVSLRFSSWLVSDMRCNSA